MAAQRTCKTNQSNKTRFQRTHIHLPANLGEQVADFVASGMGSWTFIITQTTILLVWIILNSLAFFVWKWDAYPFIALNLLLSCQAAYAAPIIMMSQNRQAAIDRKRDDTESVEVQSLFDSHDILLKINQQQLEILRLLRDGKTENVR